MSRWASLVFLAAALACAPAKVLVTPRPPPMPADLEPQFLNAILSRKIEFQSCAQRHRTWGETDAEKIVMAFVIEVSGHVRDAHQVGGVEQPALAACLAAALETMVVTPPPAAAAPIFFPFKY
ncbi:MAG: hypothetical protein GQE15_11505 [Archangiaceae bacterium]|nr:hypothetical protein [Archangiaceae bacterium]